MSLFTWRFERPSEVIFIVNLQFASKALLKKDHNQVLKLKRNLIAHMNFSKHETWSTKICVSIGKREVCGKWATRSSFLTRLAELLKHASLKCVNRPRMVSVSIIRNIAICCRRFRSLSFYAQLTFCNFPKRRLHASWLMPWLLSGFLLLKGH